MTPLGHGGFGLLVGVGITSIAPGIDQKIILASTSIGCLCPDLDLLYTFSRRGLNTLDERAGGHRYYLTHTPFFLIIVGFIIAFFNSFVGFFFTVGAILHLLLDTLFFPEGINFTFPFKEWRLKFFTIWDSHSFWAPKPIARVKEWKLNYLTSPTFWIFEVIPTFFSVALATSILYK